MLLQTEAIVLDCTYSVGTVNLGTNIYKCQPTIIFTGDVHDVSEASHKHLSGKSHDNVKGLKISDQPLKFMPRKLGQVFTNLEEIYIHSSEIEAIQKEDLVGIKNLKALALYVSQIQTIDGNVFENHPKMQSIVLWHIPLKHIGLNAFRNLKELSTLYFYNAGCVNDSAFAVNNQNAVKLIIDSLPSKCHPTMQMIENDLLAGGEFQQAVDARINQILHAFKNKN